MIRQRTFGWLPLYLSLTGSVLPRTVPVALLSTFICFAFMFWNVAETVLSGGGLMWHPNVLQFFLTVVSLLMAFHANAAYGRYWEGRTQLQLMSSNWAQAASSVMCVTYIDGNNQAVTIDDPKKGHRKLTDRHAFNAYFVHLLSALHAICAIYLLRTDNDFKYKCCKKQRKWPVEVLGGLSHTETTTLKQSLDQSFQVYHWISQLVCKFKHLPPAAAARFLTLLTAGMGAFDQACKIEDTPFPFPYAQVIFAMDVFVIFVSPVVVACWMISIPLACVLAFMLVFTYHSIYVTAHIMENPFGYRHNDLPLLAIHNDFIARLRTIMDEKTASMLNDMVAKSGETTDLPVVGNVHTPIETPDNLDSDSETESVTAKSDRNAMFKRTLTKPLSPVVPTGAVPTVMPTIGRRRNDSKFKSYSFIDDEDS